MDAYSIIATRHKYPDSASYRRLLEFILTPLQARLAVETPATAEELAQKVGLSLTEIAPALDDLVGRAILYPKEGSQPPVFKFWSMPDLLFYTVCAYKPGAPEGKQAIKLWNDFNNDWYPRIAETYQTKPTPEERVVPAYPTVAHFSELQPCEDVRELIKAARTIGLVDCPCRVVVQKCHGALDTCFMFDQMADIFVTQGIARLLTADEAMALVDKAEDEGQVHTWMNSGFMHARFMCCCCNDCCITWAPLTQHGISVGQRLAKSRFQSVVDTAKCTGDCPVCVERCLFDAIEVQPTGGGPGRNKPVATVNPDKCWGCGLCVLKCKPGALSMKLVRPLEHIPGLVSV
ncbi:MAG: 4Fe-4S dicluster domain-containing protein [Chloroflexi bacterium]|nr:4Fe-4S dicluster domain-containing protein [Chloroflexota bacterium]